MAEIVEIRGIRQLVSSLGRFESDLARTPEKANKEAGKLVAATARGKAPRRTGRLAASIKPSGGNPVTVGTRIPYARFVHFGSIHNPRPVPFLYDALDADQDAIVALYAKQAQQAANKVKGV